MELTKKQNKQIKAMQRAEITEYYVYMQLARRLKNQEDKAILEKIASQEKTHYKIWAKIRKEEVKPNKLAIILYRILAFFFGYTFTLKIMEKKEGIAEGAYEKLSNVFPEAKQIAKEEHEHEQALLKLLNEERLTYIGSIVLGLNDALVELTGAIAGLTLAFADTKIIGLTAIVMGIAASLSMASSEYLSSKAENSPNPFRSSLYTGMAYIVTVVILVLPYMLTSNLFLAFGIMIASVVLIIFIFNYYISVAQDLPFRKRFWQMILISLGVSIISFGIGFLVKEFFGLEI